MADSITRKLLTKAAKNKGYKVSYVGPKNRLLVIDNNMGQTEMFYGSRPMRSSANGKMISANKLLTLDFVAKMGVNVPLYLLYDGDNEQLEAFLQHNRPIVVKPNDSEKSKGVSIGINGMQQLHDAINLAKNCSKKGEVLLQKQIFGKLYRLYVLNGKLAAASLRKPAFVVGDGFSTVEQLINQKNTDPMRGDDSSYPLKRIDLAKATKFLDGAINNVLPKNDKLYVSEIASISAGGEAMDVTDSVNENLAKLTENIAQQLGLFVAGFDIICDDISENVNEKYLPLLEINSCPSLRMHAQPINLADLILGECFMNETIDKKLLV